MATTSIRDLRITARRLGATNVREMDEDELKEYIEENSAKNGKAGRKAKRGRPAKKVAARKARRVERDDDEDDDEDEDEAPRRRGRPKGSKNKATAVKRGPGRPKGSGRKASTAKASSKRSGKVGRPPGSGTGTRVTLKSKINWNRNFDFREGSTAQYILNQVRKSAKKYDDTDDIREDVIEKLEGKLGDIDELTFINRSTGRPHKGAKAMQMLRYRVSRTMLDYSIETGQHDGSNGGGASKSGTAKRGPGRPKGSTKRGPGRPRKAVEDDYEDDEDEDEDEAPRRKRGRPKGTKNKVKRGPGRPKGTKNKPRNATAVKRGPGRPKGTKNKVKRGPGRPKGSKNKVRQ